MVCRTQNCNRFFRAINKVGVTVRRITLSHVPPYGAEYGNLTFLEAFDHLGTVLAPKQCLYQNVAKGMENLKMQSLFRCKKRRGRHSPTNHPVSCAAVWCRIWKFDILRSFRSPSYSDCTKPMIISKGSYWYEEPEIVIAFSVQ